MTQPRQDGAPRRDAASAARTEAGQDATLPALAGERILREAGSNPVATVLVAGDLFVAGDGSLAAGPAAHPWAELRELIGGHDLALVNLECPATTRGAAIVKLGPSLAGDVALPARIRDGGFTAVTLANNHIMDRGAEGLTDTLAACRAAGLLTVGAGHDLAAAREPLLTDVAGVRVAVVNVAEREFSIAGPARPGAAPLDPWSTPQAITAARDQADAVVVVVHGGNEYFTLPRPGLRAACRALVHAGACAVVCHHAHVPLPIEVYEGAPIAYGTGNFLFPAAVPKPAGWYRGYAVSMSIAATGVTSLRLIPYEQGRADLAVRLLDPAAAASLLAELERLADVVVDDAALERAWTEHCHRQRPYVLARLLGLTRVERRLLRAGVWPFWRRPASTVPALADLFTCDSHREIVDELLAEELR